MKLLKGLAPLVERYDLFIIDQYGVLHNGTVAHPGAVDAFRRLLLEHGKTVVILSNTSRRACAVPKLLTSLGFTDAFHGAVTGGEAAWKYLKERHETMAKCALMTTNMQNNVVNRMTNPESMFHGLELEVVPIDQADFLLVEGSLQICYSDKPSEIIAIDFHTTGQMNDHIEAFIARGLERQLPLLCTNPDLVSIQQGGKTVHMGGKIAEMYAARGGQVLYFGKPLREHFEACMSLAQTTDRSRVVHIGDSMHHDIQGAVNTEIDSVFIAGGIHGEELAVKLGPGEPEMDASHLTAIFTRYGIEPTYVVPGFRW
ncbi:hypothetical protein Poli38472_004278 [Pythium oligandrum]|uniref:TIGR01459 family HAD-type hydrolase n=1 Tax=Pythium oligandrum TaxID=41045 RepID=A0A8K1CP86_PYTOL|nr:hypothetical protein Poli38472_004278 [Pythium oligandrum]|eukprot:TMW66513.1 hypothetical protein Poli38472_004278 [Pythium oligandrum]